MSRNTLEVRYPLLGHLAWGLKLFVLSFLILEALYLVLGNLFLGLGGLRRVASPDPASFTLDYRSVWTYWPGHARVRDLELTGQSDKLQWMVRVEKATVYVEIGDLFERRFHATSVDGEGASFRLRMRVEPEEAQDPHVKELPPIAGHADPPLVASGPPEPDPTDDDYDLWGVELDEVDVAMREIWIEGYRFTGDTQVKGDFTLQPLRSLELARSRLDFRSGDLALGDRTVLSGCGGVLLARLAPFDPGSADWFGVLQALSARAVIRAEVPSLAFLHHYLDEGPEIGEGAGLADVRLRVDEGVLLPGTEARVTTDRVVVKSKGLQVTAAGEASFRVDDHARGELAVYLEHGQVRFARSDAPAAEVHGARLALETPADFNVPWKPDVYALDLPSLRVSDLRRLQPLAPGGVRLRGGSALIQAELERLAGKGHGALHADLWGAAASYQGISLVGSFGADLAVQDFDLAKRTGRLRGEIGAGEVSVEQDGSGWRGWWGRMHLDELDARGADEGLDLRAAARFKLRDARPIVGVMAALDAVPNWTKGIFTMEGVAIDVDLHKQVKGLAFGLAAKAGGQSIAGRLVQRGEEKKGAFLVESKPFSAGIRLDPSDTEVTPLAGQDWLKKQLAALGGSSRRAR